MASINRIQEIILGMKEQSSAQSHTETTKTEGSLAVAVNNESRGCVDENQQRNVRIIAGGKTAHSEAATTNVESLKTDKLMNNTHKEPKEAVKALVYGQDYGTVKGINGNVLFKRGAVRLLKLCGYTHHDTLIDKNVDVANGFIGYTVKVTIVNADGEVIAAAFGSANSLEKKFADKGFSADIVLTAMASKRALVAAVKELLI